MKKASTAFLIIIAIVCNIRNAVAQEPAKLKEVYSASKTQFTNYLKFSRDGNFLVSVVGSNADVYQKKEGTFKLIQTLGGPGSQAMYPGISDDGTYIAFSAWENTFVYKKEGEVYSLLQTINPPGENPRSDLILRFTGNNKLMVVGSKGNIRFYERKENTFIEVLQVWNPSGLGFLNAALSPNGKLLATIDDKGDIHCWKITVNDALPGKPILNTNKYLGMLDISNNFLLAAGATDSLSVYQLKADLNSALPFYKFSDSKFKQVKFNQEGDKVMVTKETGLIGIYAINGKTLKPEYINDPGGNNFNDIEMSAGGQWVAAASMSGKVMKIYEGPVKDGDLQNALANAKASNSLSTKKTQPVTANTTSDNKAVANKTTPVKNTVVVKNKPAEVKKEKYPEFTISTIGEYSIYESGKKYGVKAGAIKYNLLEAKYDTVIALRLRENNKDKTIFVVIDKDGLQVFNPGSSTFINTSEKLSEYMYSEEYLWVKTDKGRWNRYTDNITSTSGYAKIQLLYNSFVIFTSPGKIKIVAWDKLQGYFGGEYSVPEGAEIIHFGGPGDFIYKVNNKVGYTNSSAMLYLPPFFDDIKLGFSNSIQLKYRGQVYSTTLDGIRRPKSGTNYIIKAHTYSNTCDRSDCRNGIIGMNTKTTGGDVETRHYEKLTLNGRILITSTYVTPVKTISTPIPCNDRAHEMKRYILQVDEDQVAVNSID